jgi:hypothetical protein
MATDNSPPRNKIIFVGAVITVAILVLLKFAFDSYFILMMEGEASAKMAQPEELHALHADEQKKLTTSPLPIDQAMAQVAKGRDTNPLITPQPSPDDAPMIGWSKGTRALAATAAGHAAGGETAAADGGAPAVPNQDALSQPADGGINKIADSGLTADGGKKPEPRHTRPIINGTNTGGNTGTAP